MKVESIIESREAWDFLIDKNFPIKHVDLSLTLALRFVMVRRLW